MKKTFKELQEIDLIVGGIYHRKPELRNTKFGYAYKRFVKKNYQPLVDEYQLELQDVRIENAMVDEKTKEILIDRLNPRGYKYSKEGLKQVIKDENQISNKFDLKETEIEPFLSSYIPEDLTEEETEILTGIVI